jgi:hypothetical protein
MFDVQVEVHSRAHCLRALHTGFTAGNVDMSTAIDSARVETTREIDNDYIITYIRR